MGSPVQFLAVIIKFIQISILGSPEQVLAGSIEFRTIIILGSLVCVMAGIIKAVTINIMGSQLKVLVLVVIFSLFLTRWWGVETTILKIQCSVPRFKENEYDLLGNPSLKYGFCIILANPHPIYIFVWQTSTNQFQTEIFEYLKSGGYKYGFI
jgi:hypothetical protein